MTKKDHFIRNILIGFAGVFVLIILTLVIVNNDSELKDSYSDFTRIIEYSEASRQENELYGVYFYSETCGACISIKEETFQFGTNNNLQIDLFMMDAQRTTGNRSDINLNGNSLNSTPTLLIYKNNSLVDYFVGTTEITNFYEAVSLGNIAYE